MLLTGAGGGIGNATRTALEEAGADVVATDLKESVGVAAHDVTSADNWARIAADVRERFGRLDCLVNNAGYSIVESIEATGIDVWRRVQAINVESVLLGLQATLPLLREASGRRQGGASVVNLSSVGGIRAAPFNAAYCAAKAAVAMFTKTAALEFATLGYGIRVNSVHPGGIETGMMGSIMQRYVDLGASPSLAAARAVTETRHPMKRLGEPQEIASGIVYLCSPASSFMTGAEMVIDGGYICV